LWTLEVYYRYMSKLVYPRDLIGLVGSRSKKTRSDAIESCIWNQTTKLKTFPTEFYKAIREIMNDTSASLKK